MLPEQFSKIHTSGKSARVACPSNGADATIEFFAEDSTVLDQVNDLRGNLIGSRAAFDTTCFIQNDVYDADRIPDEESFEGENEPVHYFEEETPSKHVYRDTAVLILKRHALVDLVVDQGMKREADLARCVREAYEQTKQEPRNQEKRLYLRTLCRRIFEKALSHRYSYHSRSGTVHVYNPQVPLRPEAELLTAVTDAVIEHPQEETRDILQKVIEFTDISSQEGLENIIRVMPLLDSQPFLESLSVPVGRISHLKSRYEHLRMLESSCLQRVPSRYQQLRYWMATHLATHLAEFCRSLSQRGQDVDHTVLAEIALSFQDESFLSKFLVPGIGINYCEALLRGFLTLHGNPYAASQISVIVRTMIRDLESDDTARKAPIVAILNDTPRLETDLFNDLLGVMIASPAMRERHGIPDSFETQRYGLSQDFHTQTDPVRREKLEHLLSSVVLNYHVYEVGRPPQKYPTLQRCMWPALQSSWAGMQGWQVNSFLVDPNVSEFTSSKWTGRIRDDISRTLSDFDRSLTVAIDKIRVPGSSTLQLHLRKVDSVWESLQQSWLGKRDRYKNMLDQILRLGFLRDSRYDFLRTEDGRYMETLVLRQGP